MSLSTIASNQIKNDTIVDADINSSSNIATTKLATGAVIQTVTSRSTTETNVQTSGSFTDITASQISVTSKLANSSFFYQASLSAESDVGASYQNYIRMAYTVNGGSTVVHDATKVFNSNSIRNEQGGMGISMTYLFDGITHSVGTVFVFFIQYQKSSSSSVHFNQQSLSGQPTSTSNASSILVQEIAV
tara:strand:+ start:381 stop:947 length:567 start_codon:yes stop_codon:yes gene_type:complete